MLKDVLRSLYLENLSYGEVAQRLNISSDTLKGILQNMEHMGYIREVCDEGEPAAGKGCCTCLASPACHKGSSFQAGKKYVLTEKGERMCSEK
jgi:predicted transcriptional regulator